MHTHVQIKASSLFLLLHNCSSSHISSSWWNDPSLISTEVRWLKITQLRDFFVSRFGIWAEALRFWYQIDHQTFSHSKEWGNYHQTPTAFQRSIGFQHLPSSPLLTIFFCFKLPYNPQFWIIQIESQHLLSWVNV